MNIIQSIGSKVTKFSDINLSSKDHILPVEKGTDITEILQKTILRKKGIIVIPEGIFTISKSIELSSNTYLLGSGEQNTILSFADGTNNNMFINSNLNEGNSSITIENLWLEGNSEKQFRPENEKRLSFCNLLYFKNTENITLKKIKATNCKQTAMHFNNCSHVTIDELNARGMGWSGISTSGTSNIKATNTYIYDSGKDVMHSGVHYDGGIGTFFSGTVEKCTGNGVMLDSKFSVFNKSVIEAKCIDCKRGISLSGDHTNQLSNVLIRKSEINDCDVGVMVSNSKHVFISNCYISNSSEYGVLLQGKFGGCDTVVTDCNLSNNMVSIAEIHNSKDNYFIGNIVSDSKQLNHNNDNEDNILDQYSGLCSVCGEASSFIYYGKSVRESYRCQSCDASLRHRGQAQAIINLYGNKNTKSIKQLSSDDSFKNLVIYEPGIIGPLRKYLDKFPNYSKSYFWSDIALGDLKNGIPNQNLECLTLKSDSIDLLITADIFEHIRKPWRAFEEIHRVLKVNGKHIFTVPIQYPLPKETVYRVDTSTDKDIHILPEHYHIAGDGGKSLVYTDFGEDMIQKLNEIGLQTEYVFIDDTNDLRKKNITLISTKT